MTTDGQPRKWWQSRVLAVLGLVVVAALSLLWHFGLYLYESIECSVGFDTDATPPPASASPQGWLCGEEHSTLGGAIWFGAFLLSLVASVALTVLIWRRWRRAIVTVPLVVVLLPLATNWVLHLPPDDCSAEARATHPEWACVH